MKVLQLCNKPPYPSVDGGTLAMNGITQGLLAAGCEVRVLSVCSDKHPVLGSRMTEDYIKATHFEAVHVDLGIHLLDAGVSWLCGESYHVKRFISKDFSAKLRDILQEEEFDVVHVESVFLTPYLPLIRKYSNAPVFLRAHNVEHLIWKRVAQSERNPLKRSYLKHLSLTLRAYECEHVNEYDGVIPITNKDAAVLRELGCRKPMEAIPFGVQPADVASVSVEPNTLYHLGSMDWMPNQEGVQWFLDKVWPKVHQMLPQLTLYLAGRKMPEEMMNLHVEGVRVVGEVPDAMAFMASKQINVVPLLSGSGIRVKIIEALSAGKVVVTTSIGAEGINYTDGKDLLIADTPDQFVEQLQRCVENAEFCNEVSRNAINLVLHEYDNTLLTERLLQFYQRVLDK
ncbi:MAG: glycosyltransferase [Bacteroidales bacterium]|jgi:glycosyltransferase involved in cell wall biosynthesis|nr:glycosyltransferase [Bacteroidales bacterium]MBQ3983629.1 glycosyltransferase [Bacteroidales bacterium]